MSRTFWLVSQGDKRRIHPSVADRQAFRADAIEIVMYFVGSGDAIVISPGNNAILVDGGSGSGSNRNDNLGAALGGKIDQQSLRAIVASHPHRDHTNFHSILATGFSGLFSPGGAAYFDNATPAADSNWQRLDSLQPQLPFQRLMVADNPAADGTDRIPLFSNVADAFLLRGSTSAQSAKSQKYWCVFLFLRFRDAWMLFTSDASKRYERLLLPRIASLNPFTHLLKVAHHGSSDGTSPELVSALQPQIAISSSNAGTKHRLEPDVRERLSASAIYATYDPRRPLHPEKDIIVRTDGRLRSDNGFQGILFEVWRREPALL